MENYIVINGKKAELTDEQLRQLGIEIRSNPFEPQSYGGQYYCINAFSKIEAYVEDRNSFDNKVYQVVNYFNDKDFAEQVMLHQLLYRKLLKYSYDNDAEDCEWDGKNCHYFIERSFQKNLFFISIPFKEIKYIGVVYFSSRDVAENAINDVVKPFVKEHPNFEW